ncbi:type III effector [Flavobacteriaceae bacterium AU392]|nr:type III effector [Flavobacteriaceae bacterium]RKM84754.1 type III effector [Flavobacteriaceae bacterium AU392]
MTIEDFKTKLKNTPETIQFSDTMNVVETNYNFTPTAFKNGELYNNSDQNLGSCKLLTFAKIQEFTKEETLACFGQFYFDEVINDPNGEGHQNIRNFMKTGFEGLLFEGNALKRR